VALVIVPTLCAMFMKLDGTPSRAADAGHALDADRAAGLVLLAIAGANVLTAVLLVATAGILWALHRFVLDRLGRAFQDRTAAVRHRRLRAVAALGAGSPAGVLGGTVAVFFVTAVAFTFASTPGSSSSPSRCRRAAHRRCRGAGGYARPDHGLEVVPDRAGALEGFGGSQDWESVVANTGSGGGGGGTLHGRRRPGGPKRAVSPSRWSTSRTASVDVFDVLAAMQATLGATSPGRRSRSTSRPKGRAGLPGQHRDRRRGARDAPALSDRVLEVLEASPVYPKLVGLESDLDAARRRALHPRGP
jgi:hypothetical protein